MTAFIFASLAWIKRNVPADKRLPVIIFLVTAIALKWLAFDFPDVAKTAFDARWHALAAKPMADRNLQIAEIHSKIDTQSVNMEHVLSDTTIIKTCLLNKTCTGK